MSEYISCKNISYKSFLDLEVLGQGKRDTDVVSVYVKNADMILKIRVERENERMKKKS